MKKVLPTSLKYKAVKEVLRGGKGTKEIAKNYHVCRQSLYFWVKKFNQSAKGEPRSLEAKYRKGARHHKRISFRCEKQILDLVVKDPGASIDSLVRKLNALGYQISKHGVYSALLRHEIQTKELRARFAQTHPLKTVLAALISAAKRAKIVEEHLVEKKPVAHICKAWGISRPTFYEWFRRYQLEVRRQKKSGMAAADEQGIVGALVRRYKRGYENHRSVGQKVVETVLSIVRANPAYSVHKIYAAIPKAAGRAIVGHHGIQNILTREGLSTFAKRLVFAGGFAPEPKVQVAPLYRPEMPVYKLRMVLAPFKSIPKLMFTNPRAGFLRLGLLVAPLFFAGLWMRMVIGTAGASPIGMVFASTALFFGIFFFVYSLKYYVSILLILKVAQGGAK